MVDCDIIWIGSLHLAEMRQRIYDGSNPIVYCSSQDLADLEAVFFLNVVRDPKGNISNIMDQGLYFALSLLKPLENIGNRTQLANDLKEQNDELMLLTRIMAQALEFTVSPPQLGMRLCSKKIKKDCLPSAFKALNRIKMDMNRLQKIAVLAQEMIQRISSLRLTSTFPEMELGDLMLQLENRTIDLHLFDLDDYTAELKAPMVNTWKNLERIFHSITLDWKALENQFTIPNYKMTMFEQRHLYYGEDQDFLHYTPME